MKINPNEPALPKQKGDMTTGLTKLEWAAVQIMASMMGNPYKGSVNDMTPFAVQAARALFAELEKQG